MLKILVIDDEPAIAEEIEIFLQSPGLEHETEVALSGREGIEQCGPDFHLVITDRRMPGMSGEEVIREIKRRRPGIKAILLTREVLTPAVQEVARAAGADEVWQKPLGVAEIKKGLKRLFRKGGGR